MLYRRKFISKFARLTTLTDLFDMLVLRILFLTICFILTVVCTHQALFSKKDETWRRINIMGAVMMGILSGALTSMIVYFI